MSAFQHHETLSFLCHLSGICLLPKCRVGKCHTWTLVAAGAWWLLSPAAQIRQFQDVICVAQRPRIQKDLGFKSGSPT